MSSSGLAKAVDKLTLWRRDPVAFVRANFLVEPDQWQIEALRAFADPDTPRISLQACAGPGKSALLAWCGWYFLSCFGKGKDHPKGLAVAITNDNLRANLWPEFAKWQQMSPYLLDQFEWTSERIYNKAHKATWFLEARSWPKTANAEEQGKTISGLHGGYVLVLVDESGAIPATVGRAAEQALATKVKFGKVMQAGNPLVRDGMLGEASTSPAWHVIRITGDPEDPKRSPRISIEWAREQIKQHGRDNPWVMAYILGQFPPTSLNALLGPDEVRAAQELVKQPTDYEWAPKVMGVDVAREGDDQSALVIRQGVRVLYIETMRTADSVQGAGAVLRLWNEYKLDGVFVDNTGGWGGGWIDQLRQLGRNPIPVNFSSSPIDPRYFNKRTEMWWLMAQWVKDGGALPRFPAEIVQELCSPTYGFKGDRLLLEPKEHIKARLRRSPDIADALCLTFAQPVYKPSPLEVLARQSMQGKPYDPMAAFERSIGFSR